MHGLERGHGFKLHNERILNQQIDSIGIGDFEILAGNRQQQLPL